MAHICRLSSSSGGRKSAGQCGLSKRSDGRSPADAPGQHSRVLRSHGGHGKNEAEQTAQSHGPARTPVWQDGGPYRGAGLATGWGHVCSSPWARAASPSHTRPSFLPTMDNGRQPWPGDLGPKWVDSGLKDASCPGAASVPYMQSPLFSCYKWQSCLSAPTCGAEARLVHLKDHSSPPQFINQASGSLSAARRSEPTSP